MYVINLRWPGRSRVRATVGEQKLVRAVVGEQNCVRAKSKIAYDPRAKLSTSRHQKCVGSESKNVHEPRAKMRRS